MNALATLFPPSIVIHESLNDSHPLTSCNRCISNMSAVSLTTGVVIDRIAPTTSIVAELQGRMGALRSVLLALWSRMMVRRRRDWGRLHLPGLLSRVLGGRRRGLHLRHLVRCRLRECLRLLLLLRYLVPGRARHLHSLKLGMRWCWRLLLVDVWLRGRWATLVRLHGRLRILVLRLLGRLESLGSRCLLVAVRLRRCWPLRSITGVGGCIRSLGLALRRVIYGCC